MIESEDKIKAEHSEKSGIISLRQRNQWEILLYPFFPKKKDETYPH